MQIILANPRGFCAGVDRAITIVERAIAFFGAPVYVRHEVVHNRYVVNRLIDLGAIFIENIDDVPDNAVLIFSAHGVSKAVKEEAKQRQLHVFDATCPLVTKVHMEVARASYRGEEVILIGHAGHIEVEGTMGQYNNPEGGIYLVESIADVEKLKIKHEDQLCFTTQTTLSVDDTKEIIAALLKRFPLIRPPRKNDICYATTNRQQAVRELASKADIVLVVGSKNSSNSNRLAELAKREGKDAYLIDFASDIKPEWLINAKVIGVTAGASAPEVLVQDVINRLKALGCTSLVEMDGILENIVFNIPKELRTNDLQIDVVTTA
ncbi:4-hydroxy-3-methylbut-2-enyl diphosphate reductase [Orbaceae bacterium ESL0721]|nr:4-hydroxy-3-methylbut-2-enyl diphosphate reductase [Orbaceae bacterium ESL0721]